MSVDTKADGKKAKEKDELNELKQEMKMVDLFFAFFFHYHILSINKGLSMAYF